MSEEDFQWWESWISRKSRELAVGRGSLTFVYSELLKALIRRDLSVGTTRYYARILMAAQERGWTKIGKAGKVATDG